MLSFFSDEENRILGVAKAQEEESRCDDILLTFSTQTTTTWKANSESEDASSLWKKNSELSRTKQP